MRVHRVPYPVAAPEKEASLARLLVDSKEINKIVCVKSKSRQTCLIFQICLH
jgi:hypothetical protein